MNRYLGVFFILASTLLVTSCSEDETNNATNSIDFTNITFWDGPDVSFNKQAGISVDDASGQDRITDNVWITRDSEGGQIFNVKSESSANKTTSPRGTLWAQGNLSNAESLNFQPFRAAVGSPKTVVGKNLVLYLTQDNIMLSVRFTSWSEGKIGSFSYVRSSAEQ